MLADDAIPPDQAAALHTHVDDCADCRAKLAALRAESEYLATAVQLDAEASVEIPKFARPANLRNFALANVATGLAIWLGQFLWKTIFGEMVLNAATWFTSIYLPDIYAVSSAAVLYLLAEGTAMLDAYLGIIVVSVLAFSLFVVWLKYLRSQSSLNLCICLLMAGIIVAPAPASALEIRHDDDVVVIPASETIDDTLLVAAESIMVEGNVTGSIIAVGQSVEISGAVGGNVVSFAESVKLRGPIGGSVIGASSAFNLYGASVGGNLWLAGESVTVDEQSQIAQNATVAAESATMEGAVGKDLHAFCETVEVNGAVVEDLEAFASRVRLLGNTRIQGDVRLRTDNEERLYQAEAAQIGGKLEFLDLPEEFEPENRYTQVEFYLWEAAKLIGAFLVGWALLSLLPAMRRLSIGAGVAGLKSAGLGLIALISTPIVAAIIAVTIVGLPIALMVLASWVLGIYLAKIVIGAILGRMLMPNNDSVPQTLLTGLLVITIVVNLPFIGGVIGFVLTITGLGLLLEMLYRALTQRADQTA
jgi:cytoskeletal protein CcmA (bactofilin family)